jgi:hypothetical protein
VAERVGRRSRRNPDTHNQERHRDREDRIIEIGDRLDIAIVFTHLLGMVFSWVRGGGPVGSLHQEPPVGAPAHVHSSDCLRRSAETLPVIKVQLSLSRTERRLWYQSPPPRNIPLPTTVGALGPRERPIGSPCREGPVRDVELAPRPILDA